MGFNRASSKGFEKGFFDLATLKSVAKERLTSTNPNASMGDIRDIVLNILELIDGIDDSGGGGTTDITYDAGNGAIVTATDEGITFSKTGGVGTFSIPDGVVIKSARVLGQTSDLSSNNFKVVFELGVDYNNDILDFDPPVWDVLNVTAAAINSNLPSDSNAIVYSNGGTPQRQLVLIDEGSITLRAINLNTYANWCLKFIF